MGNTESNVSSGGSPSQETRDDLKRKGFKIFDSFINDPVLKSRYPWGIEKMKTERYTFSRDDSDDEASRNILGNLISILSRISEKGEYNFRENIEEIENLRDQFSERMEERKRLVNNEIKEYEEIFPESSPGESRDDLKIEGLVLFGRFIADLTFKEKHLKKWEKIKTEKSFFKKSIHDDALVKHLHAFQRILAETQDKRYDFDTEIERIAALEDEISERRRKREEQKETKKQEDAEERKKKEELLKIENKKEAALIKKRLEEKEQEKVKKEKEKLLEIENKKEEERKKEEKRKKDEENNLRIGEEDKKRKEEQERLNDEKFIENLRKEEAEKEKRKEEKKIEEAEIKRKEEEELSNLRKKEEQKQIENDKKITEQEARRKKEEENNLRIGEEDKKREEEKQRLIDEKFLSDRREEERQREIRKKSAIRREQQKREEVKKMAQREERLARLSKKIRSKEKTPPTDEERDNFEDKLNDLLREIDYSYGEDKISNIEKNILLKELENLPSIFWDGAIGKIRNELRRYSRRRRLTKKPSIRRSNPLFDRSVTFNSKMRHRFSPGEKSIGGMNERDPFSRIRIKEENRRIIEEQERIEDEKESEEFVEQEARRNSAIKKLQKERVEEYQEERKKSKDRRDEEEQELLNLRIKEEQERIEDEDRRIRFGTLSPEEYSKGMRYTPLLPKEKAYEELYHPTERKGPSRNPFRSKEISPSITKSSDIRLPSPLKTPSRSKSRSREISQTYGDQSYNIPLSNGRSKYLTPVEEEYDEESNKEEDFQDSSETSPEQDYYQYQGDTELNYSENSIEQEDVDWLYREIDNIAGFYPEENILPRFTDEKDDYFDREVFHKNLKEFWDVIEMLNENYDYNFENYFYDINNLASKYFGEEYS